MDISSLSISLDLSENQLIGSLPSEVGRLGNLGSLDVSKNKLSGEIPSSLGNCLSMESLDLGGNFFQGSIPQSLSSLKAIKKLNVSHNNLTGQVPMFLAEFKLLTSLDLSFNNFEGNVPVLGVFKNASAISISGNKRLCGGILQLNLSRCTFHESTNSKASSKLILVLAIPCGFLAIILVISSTFLYCHRKTKSQHASEASWEIAFQRITYRELLEATDGFSSSNLIGTGAFGSVYKGILASSGVVVAVKVFNLLRKGASRSFMRECKTLVNIRHRNLVKVLTACSSFDFQGNDFKALIYEFLVNGSIEEWLHPIRTHDEAREPRHLDLVQRLNIAIDVTNALDYLHHHCQTPIVHCDLKPSNILLDGDMIAHVGDFGLAKFCLDDDSNQCLDPSLSSVGVKGTIGYAAPEYGIGGEVSIYGDVYSYGILLLEMFTGKRPTDGLFEEGLSLCNFVKMALPNRVMEVVDSKILREVEETSDDSPHRMKKIAESLISIMEVGIVCSAELPRERMDISKAATELNRIRSVLLRTRRTRLSDCQMKVAVLSIQEETPEPTYA